MFNKTQSLLKLIQTILRRWSAAAYMPGQLETVAHLRNATTIQTNMSRIPKYKYYLVTVYFKDQDFKLPDFFSKQEIKNNNNNKTPQERWPLTFATVVTFTSVPSWRTLIAPTAHTTVRLWQNR